MTIRRAHRAPLVFVYAILASYAATIAGAIAASYIHVPGLGPNWVMGGTAGILMAVLGMLGGRASRKLWPNGERNEP